MDQSRFDVLATLVGTQRTRRAAIAATVVTVLGTVNADETLGKKRCAKAGQTCRSAAKKKKRSLEGITALESAAIKCCSGTACLNSTGKKPRSGKKGTCRCTSGRANCDGTCTSLDELSVCPTSGLPRCLNRADCLCTKTVEGKAYCARSASCTAPCTSSSQCPSGNACVVTCCEAPGQASPHCMPSCGKV